MIIRSLAALGVAAATLQGQVPDTATLPAVTVTATRVPVDARATPAAVTVISGETLRERGVTRLGDVLREIPGASVVQSGSFGSQTSVFLRGGESDYTKVLLDGMPLNDAGGFIDIAHLAVSDVDRIEIVRGPASVLYGSDAMTGVIQIFTVRQHNRTEVDLSARGGAYHTRDASAMASVAGARTTVAVSASSHETDGVLDFNNGYRNRHASGSVHLAPREALELRAMVRHSDATFHFPTDFLGNPVDSNQYRREKRLVASVDARAILSSAVTAHLMVGANVLDGITDNEADRPGDFVFHDETHAVRRVADGRVDVRLPRGVLLTAGAEWTSQHEENSDNFDASRINRGYYAQMIAGDGAPALIALGMRLEDNERFGTHATSRLGATVRAGESTRLRATFGTAFKEPAFAEVFSTSFTRGNSALDPEQSRSLELGADQSFFTGRARLRLTWFTQTFDDRIDFIAFPPDSAVFGTYTNIGRADASGVETELQVRLATGLQLLASYAYLETEIVEDGSGREGQRLLRRPAHTASATLSYARERSSVSGTLHRVGSRYDVGYERLPWYTTLDVAGALGVLRRGGVGLHLTMRVENVLDASYEAIRGFRTPGRTALIGMRATFGR